MSAAFCFRKRAAEFLDRNSALPVVTNGGKAKSCAKAFGEFVEHADGTPNIGAEELEKMLRERADVVVLDSRPFDEYSRMSIPTGTDVPGAELVLRARDLAPSPDTTIVVNCAGRTRSIIGAQSLINAGVPNKVVALRNGTMG